MVAHVGVRASVRFLLGVSAPIVCAWWISSGAALAHEGSVCASGYNRAQLTTLATGQGEIGDARARARFASALVDCLGSPDPALRDGVAYEGLKRLFRSGDLDREDRLDLTRRLLTRLRTPDDQGFGQSFAALVLSEAVRADRAEPFMSAELREEIARVGTDYLTALRDYRGFDEREGWRHGVAHAADLLSQIGLNPNFSSGALSVLRDAIASQVAPTAQFYTYGEPERLARPVLILAMRGAFTEADWAAWFERLAAAEEGTTWAQSLGGQAGLARRHNTTAFVQSVWINAHFSANTDDNVLLLGAEAALRALP